MVSAVAIENFGCIVNLAIVVDRVEQKITKTADSCKVYSDQYQQRWFLPLAKYIFYHKIVKLQFPVLVNNQQLMVTCPPGKYKIHKISNTHLSS